MELILGICNSSIFCTLYVGLIHVRICPLLKVDKKSPIYQNLGTSLYGISQSQQNKKQTKPKNRKRNKLTT